MNSELWQRAHGVFDALVDMPIKDRTARLEQLCEDDERLLTEVASLLEAHDGDKNWLEPDIPSNPELKVDSGDDLSAQEVDGYHFGRRMAQGGMGAVYYAEKIVDGVAQSVAIKVVHLGFNSEEVVRRFTRERRILAALKHRHICPILDAGIMPDGRPYFVMPYIEHGRPISAYCREHNLSLNRRLQLFIKLCDAVHYAHQNLIIHADLKPENILIGQDGEPQLLDFGVARLLAPDTLGDSTTGFADENQRPYTPRYASPEQLAGQAPGTSSDVYSLGILLWELLCGRRPEREQGFSKPSQSLNESSTGLTLSNRRWSRQLKGDVDMICGKALCDEAQARYASVAALADDLRRYLEGLPIQARSPSLAYQLGKYVRRHPLLSSVAGTAGILLLVIAIIVIQLNSRIRDQAEQALLEGQRAEAIADFWSKLFRETDPMTTAGKEEALSAEELLDRAIIQLASDSDLLPRSRARLLTVISESYWGLGNTESSLSAARQAVELHAEQPLIATEFIDAYRHLANILASLQLADESHQMASLALAQLDQLPQPDPDRRSQVLNALALAVDEQGRVAQAADYLEQAVSLQRTATDHAAQINLATNLGNLAYMYYRLARAADTNAEKSAHLEHSLRILDEAIQRMTQLMGSDHPRVAVLLSGAGRLASERGLLNQAVVYYKRALAIADANLSPSHEQTLHARMSLAEAQFLSGQTQESLETYGKILFDAEGIYPQEHGILMTALLGQGRCLLDLGQWRKAYGVLQSVIQIAETDAGRMVRENQITSAWAQAFMAHHQVQRGEGEGQLDQIADLMTALSAMEHVPADLMDHLLRTRTLLEQAH